MGGLEESTKFSMASGVGTELDRKWRMTRPFTFIGPSKTFAGFSTPLKASHKNTNAIRHTSAMFVCLWLSKRMLATSPPDGLILFFSDRLGPLTEGWAFAEAGEEAAPVASQSVALSSDVRCILDDQLVIGSQPHVLRPLQEVLNAVHFFLLRGQPAMKTLPGQPTAHDCRTRRRNRGQKGVCAEKKRRMK